MKHFSDAAWILLGNAGARIISGAFTVLIARFIGVENYGVFVLALVTSAVAAQVADFGLQQTYMKAIAANRSRSIDLLAGVFWLRILAATVSIVLLVALGWILLEPSYFFPVVAMAIPLVFGVSLFNMGQGYDLAHNRMRSAAVGRVSNTIVIVAVTLLPIYLSRFEHEMALTVSAAYGVGSLMAGAVYLRILEFRAIFSREAFRAASALTVGVAGFFWTGLLYLLTPQLPLLMLQSFPGVAVLGVFAIAYRLPLVLYMLPGSIAQSFYPKLFRTVTEDGEYERLVRFETVCLVALGGALAVTLDALSPFILNFLVKDSAQAVEAGLYLSWLAWLLLFQAFAQPLSHVLMTSGYQAVRALIQVVIFFLAAIGYYLALSVSSLILLCYLMLVFEVVGIVACYAYLSTTNRRSLSQGLMLTVSPFAAIAVAGKCVLSYLRIDEAYSLQLGLVVAFLFFIFNLALAAKMLRVEWMKKG